jgi:hypothetical protein
MSIILINPGKIKIICMDVWMKIKLNQDGRDLMMLN